MNLTAIQIKLDPNTIKYQFTKADGGKLTYAEFIQFLKTKDQNFLNAFNKVLEQAGSQLSAYFWECIPVSQTTKGKNFEFVVVKSEALEKIKQDYSSFQEHFDRSQDNNHVVSFPSLSGDTLVVPMPNENKNYKNLKEFINHASSEQKNNFWQKVGEQMEESLLNAGNPQWLSTSGLGVSYLHVRIDRKPKYYTFEEYKEFEEDDDESNNQNDKGNKSPTNDNQSTSATNQSDDNPNQPNSPNEKNPSSSNNNSDSQPPKTDESAKLDKKPSDKNKSAVQQGQTPDKFSDNSQPTNSNKKPTNYFPWIAGGAALLIILVIFLLSKKKK